MNASLVQFTNNAQNDLADIYVFQTSEQDIPAVIATNTIKSIRKKSVFMLCNLPGSGKSYRYKGTEEIGTIVALKKYMVFYHYDVIQNTVTILHIFCTLMDDKYLNQRLLEEGGF